MVFKRYKLGDLGDICMCKRIMKSETSDIGDVPFFKIGTFGQAPDVYISRSLFEEYKNNYSFPKVGDILISAAGTIGRAVIYNGEDAYYQDSNIVWIDNDEKKVLNQYLFYLYKNIKWKVSTGSTILRLYNDNIRETEIIVPEKVFQLEISKSLSILDQKISLNTRMNAELEAMAKQLYDYWFVQFDFPDENGKPYKSSGGKMVWNEKLKREIPEGWEVKEISSILDKVTSTPRLTTNEYLQDGDFPIIDQTTDIYYAGFTNRKDAVSYQYPAVVFGDHSCAVKYVNFPFVRGADGTQVMLSNNNSISVEYLYFAVKLIKVNKGYARHFSFVKDSLIVIPSQSISLKYKSIVERLFVQITNNRKETVHLTRLRDSLLPMLMNGQVTIE